MRQELKSIRKRCLDIAFKGGDANLQSCFSSFEVLWALYHGGMNWRPEIATSSERDLFVLSKGQSSLALITILEDIGLYAKEEVNSFCSLGSRFSMQLDRAKFLKDGGVENSAGSLGHGFPMAVGMAYAKKIQHSEQRVYVLAGDGEMNEGTMWEAAAFAGGHHLGNLTLIIDDNNSIGRMLDMSDMRAKLESFGFNVDEVNGHDVDEIQRCVKQQSINRDKPCAIIAKTVRGYGSKTLMEDNAWFHKAPNEAELKILKSEVDEF